MRECIGKKKVVGHFLKDEVVKAVEFRVYDGKLQYRSLIVYIENSFNSDGYLSYEKELRVGQGEFSEWENVPEIEPSKQDIHEAKLDLKFTIEDIVHRIISANS